ncbi:iron complex transport system ATP-binding protein [Mesorhizobium albiziae]|uniref:Iron complex transport system ATP-binding protein n=1 Tax=Neomesorhizobium albiziae TaxID=335020 RepID=A0A1I4DLX5_9HYPH|nr:hypothetical protein [Mesorhizobium albiziae]GLS31266.1 hypothetical protein GCM10007937_29760 [Mesorhizobium albiziae]SFK94592.1 iron complex transport system ATP-binding protein [Mesorhizobium albiziae]
MAAGCRDRIIVLTEGRISARGVPAEIVQPDLLARVYGVAMGTIAHPLTGEPVTYLI